MAPTYHIVTVVSTLLMVVRSKPMHFCDKGEYLVIDPVTKTMSCLSCTNGVNFMDKSQHREQKCYRCQPPPIGRCKTIIENCTKYHDSVHGCLKGCFVFSRTPDGHNFNCKPCKNCAASGLVEIQTCRNDEDTLCGKEGDKDLKTLPMDYNHSSKSSKTQHFPTHEEKQNTHRNPASSSQPSGSDGLSTGANAGKTSSNAPPLSIADSPKKDSYTLGEVIISFISGIVLAVFVVFLYKLSKSYWRKYWRPKPPKYKRTVDEMELPLVNEAHQFQFSKNIGRSTAEVKGVSRKIRRKTYPFERHHNE